MNTMKEEDAFKMLAEHSTDIISRHSPDGVYLYCSPSVKRTLGYDPEELIGTTVYDLFHPDDLDMMIEARQRKMETKQAETSFYRIKTRDDGYKWMETISKIIWNPETGEPVEVHAFTRDVTQRKQYEDALEASIQEKEVLLKEIHHRVKNNLSLVSGLLTIQKMISDNEEFHQVATDCEMRIKSISLVHEKLYHSSTLSKINFETYVRDLFESTQSIYDSDHEVDIQIQGKDVSVNIIQAIPVALILNELITNSFKYAFRGRTSKKIAVAITEENGRITIHYHDNGIGIPDDFDYREATSMGFTIIRTLITQLEADFTMTGDGGTEVIFSFKKTGLREMKVA